jgi:hypothetical protein
VRKRIFLIEGEDRTFLAVVTRRRLMNQVLAEWSEDEVLALFRLTRQYANSLQQK